jgi:hypothetical protein
VAYRHGLRASELVALRWDDIDLTTGRLHVRRAKGGDASVHPISARESRALRKLLREAPTSPYVFISERRAPLSAAGYQRMVARAGMVAKFRFLVHSHMLRHALRVQARRRRPGHSRHPGLSRPPFDHVHRPLSGFDTQSVQAFLEGLALFRIILTIKACRSCKAASTIPTMGSGGSGIAYARPGAGT